MTEEVSVCSECVLGHHTGPPHEVVTSAVATGMLSQRLAGLARQFTHRRDLLQESCAALGAQGTQVCGCACVCEPCVSALARAAVLCLFVCTVSCVLCVCVSAHVLNPSFRLCVSGVCVFAVFV